MFEYDIYIRCYTARPHIAAVTELHTQNWHMAKWGQTQEGQDNQQRQIV